VDLVERTDAVGRRHPWEVARARFFLRLLARLDVLDTTATWLDVGAGDAWFARQLGRALPASARVVCWDVHYGDDVLGRADADAPGTAAPSAPGGADLSFCAERPPGTFGGILALDVVEHVEDDVGFVRDLVETSLAPGGWMLVSTPAYQGLFSAHDRFLRHYRRYAPRDIAHVLESAGLAVVAGGGLFHSLLPVRVAQVVRERVRPPRATPEGIGAWRGGPALTRALDLALGLDTRLSLALAARRRVVLPGLSTWMFGRRPGDGPPGAGER